jgi:tRNA U34 5-methylaminomethyl-2-thiouridine-forming methyltransferase MnmC
VTFNSAFEIVKTTEGATSIRDNASGEIMHNPIGPWKESRALYAEQSGLGDKLLLPLEKPLVLFDVGMGAAFNTMAALERWMEASKNPLCRDLHIVSFEENLNLLHFALAQIENFPESAPYKEFIEKILNDGAVDIKMNNSQLKWELIHGDFIQNLSPHLPKAEIVFFDPYSTKINPDMWALECFSRLRPYVDGCLLTYSISTHIRTAMLVAGFFVGEGEASGKKLNTTVADTDFNALKNPLGPRWMGRWERSHVGIPLGNHGLNQEMVHEKLLNHPQFAQKLAKT